VTISPLLHPIAACINFGGRELDVINCAKFQLDRFRGFGAPGGRKSLSPIDWRYHPYNSVRINMLHCDRWRGMNQMFFLKEEVKCKNFISFGSRFLHRIQQRKMPFHRSTISYFVWQEGRGKCAEYVICFEFFNKRMLLLSNKRLSVLQMIRKITKLSVIHFMLCCTQCWYITGSPRPYN